jgi:hypothetical protein
MRPRAAAQGATLQWIDGREHTAQARLFDRLVPAHDGLLRLGVARALADAWMGLPQIRLAARLSGTRWQLQRRDALGGDLQALTLRYVHRASGAALHRRR